MQLQKSSENFRGRKSNDRGCVIDLIKSSMISLYTHDILLEVASFVGFETCNNTV